MRKALRVALVLSVLGSGCVEDAGPLVTAAPTPGATSASADATGGPASPDSPGAADLSSCRRDDVEGCVLLGLALQPALTLEEALLLGPALGGENIAVFRAEPACVPAVSFTPGGGGGLEPSRFAYVDAEQIEERRLAAVQAGLSPPITGYHISQSYWDHWEAEWAAAQARGTSITAVIVYVPETRLEAAAADDRVAAAVPVVGRRTDSLDPSYPGELLVDSASELGALLGEMPVKDCS